MHLGFGQDGPTISRASQAAWAADFDHRRAGRGPRCGSAFPWPTLAPACSARWYPHCAARAQECRAKANGPDLAFAGARFFMRISRPPAGDGKGSRQTGRQHHPTSIPPASSRPRTATSTSPPRGADLGTLRARTIARPNSYPTPTMQPARHARRIATPQRRNRRLTAKKSTDTWVSRTQRRRVPLRSDLFNRPDFEDAHSSISASPRTFQRRAAGHISPGRQPVTLSRTPSEMVARPPDSASRPTRCWLSLGLRRTRSVR